MKEARAVEVPRLWLPCLITSGCRRRSLRSLRGTRRASNRGAVKERGGAMEGRGVMKAGVAAPRRHPGLLAEAEQRAMAAGSAGFELVDRV